MKIFLLILGSLLFSSSIWSQSILYKKGKYGLSDASGNVLLNPKYDFMDEFVNGYARIKLNEKYGLLIRKVMKSFSRNMTKFEILQAVLPV